jgi:hypothetical protein
LVWLLCLNFRLVKKNMGNVLLFFEKKRRKLRRGSMIWLLKNESKERNMSVDNTRGWALIIANTYTKVLIIFVLRWTIQMDFFFILFFIYLFFYGKWWLLSCTLLWVRGKGSPQRDGDGDGSTLVWLLCSRMYICEYEYVMWGSFDPRLDL